MVIFASSPEVPASVPRSILPAQDDSIRPGSREVYILIGWTPMSFPVKYRVFLLGTVDPHALQGVRFALQRRS
jgi:hypothetical protein